MLSGLARADLEDLRADGLAPTDEDVVRLNALALKVSDGPETTAWNAPRFAVAGGVVFWEPTMAALAWHRFARTFAGSARDEDWMFAFACAHGRERGFLDALRDPAAVRRAVDGFVAAMSATVDEVDNAVWYVTVGDEPDAEPTDIARRRAAASTPDERELRNFAAMERTLAAAAAATGLTFDDIMCQTPSRLCGMIYAAHVQAGMALTRTSAKAHADYLATLNAITKRLRAEKEAASPAADPPDLTGKLRLPAEAAGTGTVRAEKDEDVAAKE